MAAPKPKQAKLSIETLLDICSSKESLLEMLRKWNLIPEEGDYLCPECGGLLYLQNAPCRTDGYQWVCPQVVSKNKQKKRRCGFSTAFRTGTFFARSHKSIKTILCFVHSWVWNRTLADTVNDVDMSMKTAVDWGSFCREVVFYSFIVNGEQIGGAGLTVEIGESHFGRRKYHRGRLIKDRWVFGGYERGSGRIFMVVVEDRTRETLIPLIKNWIKPKTTIISNCWPSYACLKDEDYDHLTVSHKLHFQKSSFNAHTNSIEASWSGAKKLIRTSGRTDENVSGNLAKVMFIKKCNALGLNRLEEFLKLAGQMYNPLNPASEAMATEIEKDIAETDSDSEDGDD